MNDHKRKPRRGPAPTSGEGRQVGLPEADIPSGLNHLTNHPTPASKPEVPARPDFPIQNAHGVVPSGAREDRPDAIVGKPPKPVPLPVQDEAVPVYVVEAQGKGRLYRRSLAESVHVSSTKVTRLCSRDFQRVEVQLLNEDSNNDVRFAYEPGTLTEGRGALLWHGTNSYQKIPTQDDLYALADTADVDVSIILTTEVAY